MQANEFYLLGTQYGKITVKCINLTTRMQTNNLRPKIFISRINVIPHSKCKLTYLRSFWKIDAISCISIV